MHYILACSAVSVDPFIFSISFVYFWNQIFHYLWVRIIFLFRVILVRPDCSSNSFLNYIFHLHTVTFTFYFFFHSTYPLFMSMIVLHISSIFLSVTIFFSTFSLHSGQNHMMSGSFTTLYSSSVFFRQLTQNFSVHQKFRILAGVHYWAQRTHPPLIVYLVSRNCLYDIRCHQSRWRPLSLSCL